MNRATDVQSRRNQQRMDLCTENNSAISSTQAASRVNLVHHFMRCLSFSVDLALGSAYFFGKASACSSLPSADDFVSRLDCSIVTDDGLIYLLVFLADPDACVSGARR